MTAGQLRLYTPSGESLGYVVVVARDGHDEARGDAYCHLCDAVLAGTPHEPADSAAFVLDHVDTEHEVLVR